MKPLELLLSIMQLLQLSIQGFDSSIIRCLSKLIGQVVRLERNPRLRTFDCLKRIALQVRGIVCMSCKLGVLEGLTELRKGGGRRRRRRWGSRA